MIHTYVNCFVTSCCNLFVAFLQSSNHQFAEQMSSFYSLRSKSHNNNYHKVMNWFTRMEIALSHHAAILLWHSCIAAITNLLSKWVLFTRSDVSMFRYAGKNTKKSQQQSSYNGEPVHAHVNCFVTSNCHSSNRWWVFIEGPMSGRTVGNSENIFWG